MAEPRQRAPRNGKLFPDGHRSVPNRLDESDRRVRDSLREFLEREVAPDLPAVDAEPVSKAAAVEYQRSLGELGIGPGAGEVAAFAGRDRPLKCYHYLDEGTNVRLLLPSCELDEVNE